MDLLSSGHDDDAWEGVPVPVAHFKRPPLIEVVAELRWQTALHAVVAPAFSGVPVQVPGTLSTETEAFFARFAQAVDKSGYRNSERLFPPGSPLLPEQPAIRFRQRAGEPPLLQVGVGVFSANGLPPTYSNWGSFLAVIEDGVSGLIESRTEGDESFQLSVQYINAFGERFWGGGSPGQFIESTLGFSSNLPSALSGKVSTEDPTSAAHEWRVPLSSGSHVTINVGEGAANDEKAVILNVAARTPNVPSDLATVMSQFGDNHRLIRDMFMEMTLPVYALMDPVEVEE